MATYTRRKWEESENLRKQQEAIEAYKQTKPGEYTSENKQLSEEALKNWQNYKPFNFDINRDALYNQYKNNYMTQSKLAMQDAMGQAASMTGGYGSSYGQSVGQQIYQGYLQKLNDVVPALQEAAYNRYLQGKEDAYNNWQTLQALESQDYNRYMDSVNLYNAEYDRLYDEYNDAYNREYGQYQYEDQRDYQEYQDAVAQEQWQKQFDADQAYRSWQMAQAARAEAKANASVTGYDNENVNTENIKIMQSYLGIPATGYWDETSYNAAGGLTADEAWRQYNNTYNDYETGDVGRELERDNAFVNNYLAQTPTNTATPVYKPSQGMFEPTTRPLTQAERKEVMDYINSADTLEDFGAARAALNDLAGQGVDVSELWKYYNSRYRPFISN